MPVVAYRDDQVRPLGTCFAISNHGIALTARHVVDEAMGVVDWRREPEDFEGEWRVGALYAAEPGPCEDVPDLLGGILPAHKINLFPGIDIAAIHLNLPTHEKTGQLLRVPANIISPAIPLTNTTCFGLGYHSMFWSKEDSGIEGHCVVQSYSASRGEIADIYFPQRDAVMLNFPCFQTNARFDGGMSGGPIIGENGNVIGVICSSIGQEPKSQHISYGSLIGPALFLQLEASSPSGLCQNQFLYDFVQGGSVRVDETISSINLQRSEVELRIDFGSGRHMEAVLKT